MILFQLFISCITLLGNISNNATTPIDDSYSSDEKVSNSEIVTNCQFCEGEENYVTCVDHEREISSNKEIYKFTSNTEIDYVESSGDCTLISYERIDTNKIQCIVGDFIDHGEIKLSFYFESEFVDNYTLHFAVSEEGIFYSSGRTLDCAERLAGQELEYSLKDEDADDVFDDNNIDALATTYVSGSINGYFKWTDDQGNIHPLVGAKIELTINGGKSGSTQTTYSGNDGYYSFTYSDVKVKNDDGKANLTIYLENDEIKVQVDGSVYKVKKTMAEANKNYTYSFTFSPSKDGDYGKAASIYQAAQCFLSFALTKDTISKLKACTIEYPVDDTKCYYTRNKNKISIIEEESAGSGLPNSYSAWDVIGHEYGHHIQNCYDFDDNPGGPHQLGKNAVDYLIDKSGESQSKAKKNGIKLSFEEAWATYWSTAAQETFDEEWKSIETVGNTIYESYRGTSGDLNSYGDSKKNYGDCDELAIIRILYKLYSSATDDYDKFGLGFDKLFKIMCNYKPLTFSDFANALYDEGYNKNDLGLLFAQYNVVPNSVYVDGGKLETRTCPTFVWSTYMGSDYLYFNKFEFVLQSEYGTELVNATITTTSTTTCSYTLTSSEWVKVRAESYGSYFTVYLVAWQTDYVTTGGYYSELFTFKNTTAYSVRVDE